jgi:hypothetical protein
MLDPLCFYRLQKFLQGEQRHVNRSFKKALSKRPLGGIREWFCALAEES